MYPENPEGTQVIVGSMNMGYISDTARNRTHNLFRPKREPIPLGHSDEIILKDVRVSHVDLIRHPLLDVFQFILRKDEKGIFKFLLCKSQL